MAIPVTVLSRRGSITGTIDPLFQLLTVSVLRLILLLGSLPHLLTVHTIRRNGLGSAHGTTYQHDRGKRDGRKRFC
jgi:hypothetical protein